MQKLALFVVVAALPFVLAQDARAQIGLGPTLSAADGKDFGIGVVAVFPLDQVNDNLEIAAAFEYYFPDGFDYFQIDGIARYLFSVANPDFTPYVAGGLVIGRASVTGVFPTVGEVTETDTQIGLAFGGGIKYDADSVNPFGELLLGIGDIPDFGLSFGLTFTVGG